jgi:hypothetical protein
MPNTLIALPDELVEETILLIREKRVIVNCSRSQIVTLKEMRGTNIKYQPYAFTEHGILMLSSVLKSNRAVQVNIQIMRTFVRLREMLASNERLLQRLDELETDYDEKFKVVFRAIRQLMTPQTVKRKPIGFHPKASKK